MIVSPIITSGKPATAQMSRTHTHAHHLHHITMFALSASTVKVSAVAGLSARAATRSARRGVSLRVRAEGETTTTTTTEEAAPVEASTEEVAAPAAFKAAIDPADGSIAEAAPLGDDMSMFTDAMVALSNEITNDQSLFRQVINTRTFTLADGVVKSSTFPATGAFLVPVVVLATLAASLAPVLRGNEEFGLEKAPKDFFMFKAESEMTNGRGRSS